jgi:hypothetical protein
VVPRDESRGVRVKNSISAVSGDSLSKISKQHFVTVIFVGIKKNFYKTCIRNQTVYL